MKKILLLPLTTCALLLSGCNDFLGIKPKGALYPETDQDYEYMLNNSDMLKTGESYPAFLTDDAYLPYESSNNLNQGYKNSDPLIQTSYSYQPSIFGPSEQDPLWEYSYSRLYYYNTVINWADGNGNLSTKGKEILAEALTGRALEYLYLVNGYGKHYDAATASSDLGVPLITLAQTTQDLKPRATVQEVYDLILGDLNRALPLLPEKPVLNTFRASKAAGYGVLARVQLYMGNYPEALKAANMALKTNSALVNYKTLTKNPERLGMGMTDMPQLRYNKESIYARTPPYSFGNINTKRRVFPSKDLESIFDKENDMRWILIYDHHNQKYYRNKEDYIYLPGWEINLGIGTPEMYLIAAESEARVGNPSRAVELLNNLRSNRLKEYKPLVLQDKEEILKQILLERRREFAEVGLFRLIDLKRLAKEPKYAVTFTRELNGKTRTIVPGDPRLVLPIPEKIIRKNPALIQNER